MKRIAGIAIAVTVVAVLSVLVIGQCTILRSVRFDPAQGLRVLEATYDTRFVRLPWSSDTVPLRYELTTSQYRIVFETPGSSVPYRAFIESATAGTDEVFVEGSAVFGSDGLNQYYLLVADPNANPLVFVVKDQSGNVLGRHTLSYSMRVHSYFCGFEGP